MSEGSNRNLSLILSVVMIGFIYAARLFYLQVIDSSYVDLSNSNSKKILTIHPNRGLIYDRNDKLIAYNDNFYDLMVSYPFTLKNFDTVGFCNIIGITKAGFYSKNDKSQQNGL
jgi:penicillin-binding protein 2